jgi:ABC-2 type transport system permease protein
MSAGAKSTFRSAPRSHTKLITTLHAEWTKVRTVGGPSWLLLTAVVLTIGLSAMATAAISCPAGCRQDIPKISLTGTVIGQAIVAILAVVVVSGEYTTAMIRTTFTAMPRRWLVLAAKAIVLSWLVLLAGAIAVLGSLLLANLILSGNGLPAMALTDGGTLRAAIGSVLYLVLIALLSLGIATAARDAAVAIGTVLGLLFLFPILAAVVTDPDWQRHLKQIGPMSAGLAIQATVDLDSLPIGPWPGLGVLGLWAAGSLLLAGLLLHLRDA